MKLTSTIIVNQSVDQVWKFLSDPTTSHKWDKSVDHVILPESGFTGLGCEVETVAPSGMKQPFIVTEFQPPRFFKFRLLKSTQFKDAELSFHIEKVAGGTKITHEINFKLHFRAAFLYPILLLTSKRALGKDLGYLKNALDTEFGR